MSLSASPVVHRHLRRVAIAIGVVALLIAIAWLAVPHVVRSQLESRATEALGRRTTVEAVDFNPFTLRLTLRNLAIEDTSAGATAPLVAVDVLDADVSSASLWHRAPVLDALRIAKPAVSLSRNREGRYNAQDLVDRALAPSPDPTPGFSLNNIEIVDGSIAFADGVTGRRHVLAGLAMGIPFLSSLPYETDIRVKPTLSGTLDDARFDLGGSTVPFAQRREASLELDLDTLQLPQFVAYLPSPPRITLTRGALTTRLAIVFVDGAPGERKLEVRGTAQLDDVALARDDGSPLASASRIAVALDAIDLVKRDARIATLAVDKPSADVKRLRDGTLELAQPVFERSPKPATPDAPWTVTLAKATVAGGTVALTDEGSSFATRVADVAIDASNLSTKPGEVAHVALAFVSADRVASFEGEADVQPLVPSATGSFALSKFSLGLLFPYYKDVLAVEVQKGSLDLAGKFSLAQDGSFALSQGKAAIADLALAYPGNAQPFWRFPAIDVEGIDVDARARSVRIARAGSRNAVLSIARERNGTLDYSRIMKTTAQTGTARDEDTWSVRMGKLDVDHVSIDVEDRVPQPPVRLAARDLSLTATDVSNARDSKAKVLLRTRLGESGRASYDGMFGTNPFAMAGAIDVANVQVGPLRPYIEAQVDVSVTGGLVSAKGRLAVEARDRAKVEWKGDVVVTEFSALDKPTASDLVRWKRLALTGMEIATDPRRAVVGGISVEDYYARLIVYQDASLNLTHLLTPRDAQGETPGESAPLPVTLGRVELARGNVNFSDFFIHPNYSANLTDVTGSVTTMSAEQAGDVAISARVDHSAPVEVSGRIHPFAKDLTLDIAAKARDIDLPPLTPYSVKYAGYGIDKGKLTFDVHYKVDQRKLSAENRLVLDQLTFNPKRIDSETATKLPVLLAVSLLKDSRGVIDVSLPIAGSLDDPQFSVGGLIVRVIVNLITKAVTAPFALLSAAFGKGEELSVVPFAAGSAVLDARAQERIDTLGKALADRPGLKLDIAGHATAAADGEAMRHAAVEAALKREKMKSLAAGGTAPASASEVVIAPDERARWLEAAYRESSIEGRPRNFIGMLKDVPPAEMESMLFASTKVDDDALRALASARAQAVKDALVARSVAGERLFLVAAKAQGDGRVPVSAPASRVDLALR